MDESNKHNYILHYKKESVDDCINFEYPFAVSNDDNDEIALETVYSLIENINTIERGKIENKEKSLKDFYICKPVKLERIVCVIKENVEKIEMPLRKPASRERSDSTEEKEWDYGTLL
ncbi:MAG: hypothetical protein AABX77_01625 [Nanoarchaeota archaeon]